MSAPHVHSPVYYQCDECASPATTGRVHHLPGGPLCAVCYARYRAIIPRVFGVPFGGDSA